MPLVGEHHVPAVVRIHEVSSRRTAVAAELSTLQKEMVDPAGLTEEKIEEVWRNGLRSPHNRMQEWIEVSGDIQNVSRAFTHQFVRGRVGWKYSQQSMRWIDATGFEVYTPPLLDSNLPAPYSPGGPELLELIEGFDVLMPADSYWLTVDPHTDPRIHLARWFWDKAQGEIQAYYAAMYRLLTSYLEDTGNRQPGPTAAQDARGILPTNVLTNISFSCSYLSLQNAAKGRLCHAAQHEIRYVFEQLKRELHRHDPELGKGLKIICQQLGFCPQPDYESVKCSLPLAGVPAPKKVQGALYEIIEEPDIPDAEKVKMIRGTLEGRAQKEAAHPDG